MLYTVFSSRCNRSCCYFVYFFYEILIWVQSLLCCYHNMPCRKWLRVIVLRSKNEPWFQASAAVSMRRPAPFLGFTQRGTVVSYSSGKSIGPIFLNQAAHNDCLTLAEEQDKEKSAKKLKRAYILVVYHSDVWTSFSNCHTETFAERSLRNAYDVAIHPFSGL